MALINELKKDYKYGLIILAGVFLLFGQGLHFDYFIFDDGRYIFNNPRVNVFSFENVSWYWLHSKIPFIYNVWQIIYFFFGENTFFYRFISLIFYSLNGYLLFFWGRSFLKPFFKNVSGEKLSHYLLFATLLVLFHPTKVENIIWITEMRSVFSVFFGLLALNIYQFYFNKLTVPKQFLIFIFFSFSLLFKPSTAVLPVIFLLLDVVIGRFDFKRLLFRNAHYWILTFYVVLFHKFDVGTGVDVQGPSVYMGILTFFGAIKIYVIKFLFPYNLSFDYGLTADAILDLMVRSPWGKFSMFFVFVLMWGIVILFFKKKYKVISISVALFIIPLLPNAGIFFHKFQNISIVADRYMYFSSIGQILLWSLLLIYIDKVSSKHFKKVAHVFIFLSFISYVFLTSQYVMLWKDSKLVLKNSYKQNGGTYVTNFVLAQSYINEKQYDEAIPYIEKAREIIPTKIDTYNLLLQIYLEKKDLNSYFKVLYEMNKGSLLDKEELVLKVIKFLIKEKNYYELYLFMADLRKKHSSNKSLNKYLKFINENLIDDGYYIYRDLAVYLVFENKTLEAKRYFNLAKKTSSTDDEVKKIDAMLEMLFLLN